MHKALIQNAKNDVDDEDGGDQQKSESDERILKGLRGPLERPGHVGGHDSSDLILDKFGGITKRGAGLQIEADSDTRQLAEVVDGKRPNRWNEFGNRIERD